MQNGLRFLLTLLCLLGPGSALAGPERLSDARVMFTEVKDTRTTGQFFGECEVEIKVMGRAVSKSLGIRSVEVTYAVDNTGMILLNKERKNISSFFHPNDGAATLTHKVSLKNPARSAHYIQSLKGTIELFSPTLKNGGRVEIENFQASAGKPLAEAQLKPHGISIMYLTKEILEQRKKEQMEKARKKASKEIDKLGEEMGQAFMNMFEGMLGGMMGNDKFSLNLWVKDPEKMVVDIQFLDATGKKLNTSSRSNMGEMRQVGFKELPGPGTKLLVYLATKESIRQVEFSLNQIPLP